MSSEEFTLLIKFSQFEPWGCEIENWRMGTIASTIVNTTPRTKGAKPMKASDFYSNPYKRRADGLTAEQRAFLKKRTPRG